MQFKHVISANRIKVFLSSSMKSKADIEQRNMITAFLERIPLFELFTIEKLSGSENIQKRYIEAVKSADIVLLILQNSLREGVINEFIAAKRHNKIIFAFVYKGKKEEQLKKFIKDEVHPFVTNTIFNDNKDLIDKIEATLLEDLVKKYVELHAENEALRIELEKSVSQSHKDHIEVKE